jgi:energy-coupling factor transporter ATP-binding protein EcfA2
VRSKLSYADAVRILGDADRPGLELLDQVLGGIIVAAAAATGRLELLTLLHARDELIVRTNSLLSGLSKRVRGAKGKSRTDLLIAAHSIVAVNSYFEELSKTKLPVKFARLKLTPADELILAGASTDKESAAVAASKQLVDAALRAPLPYPEAHRPYEQNIEAMETQYQSISTKLISLIASLEPWNKLTTKEQDELKRTLTCVPAKAARRYAEDFRRLATECPEFRTWIYLNDSAATRTSVAMGLAGLQELLEALSFDRTSSRWPSRLASVYRSELMRPIIDSSPDEIYAGLAIPLLCDSYVSPSFRLSEYDSSARPAEEDWWSQFPISHDIVRFVAGHLTSPTCVTSPLVVLGHPGSGKSLLTKVLSARLPPQDYLPIRVELRRVAADKKIISQIEEAISEVINEHIEWSGLVEATKDALPVVFLDGFDEMLQATKVNRANYLDQVQEFQQREADQGRRVAVVVTSRTILADRMKFPPGTVLAKLEPFDDEDIAAWLSVWNEANTTYFGQHSLQELRPDSVLAHRDLAIQPLLLLMLALYDSDGNTLQCDSSDLAQAELYEQLLSKFVRREVEKLFSRLEDRARRDQTARELRQLSILALGMFNRRTKTLSEEDLEDDIRSFGYSSDARRETVGQFDQGLKLGELAVGRFFFVLSTQGVTSNLRLREYEFLHATFGEYLVARAILQTLTAMAESPSGELWLELSFTPLTNESQIMKFLGEGVSRLSDDATARLRTMLRLLFMRSLEARTEGYDEGYLPRFLDVASRHAIYSANLLLLNVLVYGQPVCLSEFFDSLEAVLDRWLSFALLWRSRMDSTSWRGFVKSLEVSPCERNGHADLEIRFPDEDYGDQTKPFQMLYWLSREVSSDSDIGFVHEQAVFLHLPELELLLRLVEPLLSKDPMILSVLIGQTNATAHSVVSEAAEELRRFS